MPSLKNSFALNIWNTFMTSGSGFLKVAGWLRRHWVSISSGIHGAICWSHCRTEQCYQTPFQWWCICTAEMRTETANIRHTLWLPGIIKSDIKTRSKWNTRLILRLQHMYKYNNPDRHLMYFILHLFNLMFIFTGCFSGRSKRKLWNSFVMEQMRPETTRKHTLPIKSLGSVRLLF